MLSAKYMFVMCCCNKNQCAICRKISRTKMKTKLKVKTNSYHVLHLLTSSPRVHISRLLSKIASKLWNDLRSNVFNSSPSRFALHVNETDIMYNILKTRSSLPHREDVSKTCTGNSTTFSASFDAFTWFTFPT